MNILVIKSSVNEKKGSFSSAISDLFVKFYKEFHPDHNIEVFDLNDFEVANNSLNKNNLLDHSFFEKNKSDFWIDKIKQSDKIVFSTSMTNFHYSATTKNFFDTIIVSGKTFKYDKDSVEAYGLVNNIKNIQIITSQGAPLGWYPFGDHTNLIYQTFKWIGAEIKNKPFILAGTKVAPYNTKSISEILEENSKEIKELARIF
ncbi:FMN-dependent NADH-azoreductase [Mesomycoplasma conjunctivae]|uniref:FMN dependent NADH:quinone oxidoreductase n=1 Tax=Mesomycoplasma conjunctivae (strain ATCC 25834 / NCTC 10147 / HRC/581) TaxID=572263 RepID=C5J6Q5_MESCH|nr:FMN-dependent NADH-azoreductase [Mesomycoplasma conjunctivae]CAT05165.1 FMN-dependent NADH-azoreductase [Mesomycoplasma conjunctivae]VEU66173.1 FMN-dependent NADH-azoreductase [Mesomycoplasma conjunctivae]